MKARAQRKPFPAHQMSPWEENTWFETPTISTFTGDNTTTEFLIVKRNPRRIAIVFTNRGPQTCMVTHTAAGLAQGWILNPTVNPFEVLQKDYGNLVEQEWYLWGLGVGAFSMSVTEAVLRDWPGD